MKCMYVICGFSAQIDVISSINDAAAFGSLCVIVSIDTMYKCPSQLYLPDIDFSQQLLLKKRWRQGNN